MKDTRETGGAKRDPLLEKFLRDLLPEIKLALGALIDRENRRKVPDRYARSLPDTLLAVTLRPEMADAVAPVATEVERDLTDSCSRHGSLYDRSYRVELRRAEGGTGPMYRVSAHAGHPPPAEAPMAPAGEGEGDEPQREIPTSDPDETRMEGAGGAGWEPGRFLLVVEDDAGESEAREVFRLTEPLTTIGRRSEDPGLHTTVSLADVPHVSRRQLAIVWDIRNGRPGFWLFNIGLNAVHVGDREVPGHRAEPGALHLERVPDASSLWVTAGSRIRLGEKGPTLRIEEVADEPAAEAVGIDPDATRLE